MITTNHYATILESDSLEDTQLFQEVSKLVKHGEANYAPMGRETLIKNDIRKKLPTGYKQGNGASHLYILNRHEARVILIRFANVYE